MNTSEGGGVKTKVCSKCKFEKPVELFHKNKSRKDGLYPHCKICRAEKHKNYYKANSDKLKEYQKEYRKDNSDKLKEYQKEYRKDNLDKAKEYQKEYRKDNLDKLKEYKKKYIKFNPHKLKEQQKKYRRANPDKMNAKWAKRNAKKIQATPPWLTKEHLSAIRMYYTESKALEKVTGIKHHVDHIVPLQGKNVCGLHVPWNLNVLTATENTAKNNSYPNEWEDT